MAEIRNKFYLNQEVWVRTCITEPKSNLHHMKIVQIVLQNGGIAYGLIDSLCPAHCAFAGEDEVYLTKQEAARGGD